VSGTPQSVLSSHSVLAVLSDEEEHIPNVFQRLSLMRSVAQKVRESATNEKPSIGRPSREAKELLKRLDDESLQGLF
jgi:hypothetical protein